MGWTQLILHVVLYVVSPRVLVVHLVSGGLWASLWWRGAGRGLVLRRVLASHVVTYAAWVLVPHGLGSVLALWVVLRLYEHAVPRHTLAGPVVFIADSEKAHNLQTCVDVHISADADEGPVHMYTSFSCVVQQGTFSSTADNFHGVDLDTVVGVQAGLDLELAKTVRQAGSQPSQCFRLEYEDGPTVTVVTDSEDTQESWVQALGNLLGERLDQQQNQWLSKIMHNANIVDEDEDEDEAAGPAIPTPSLMMTPTPAPPRGISLEASVQMLQEADRPTDKAYAAQLFSTFISRVGSKKTSTLNRTTFSKFFDLASKRPEIHEIYSRMLKNQRANVLHPQKLEEFMHSYQKEFVALEQCKTWIKEYERIIPPFSFTSVGFTTFMLSEEQSIFKRAQREMYQDMSRPLCDYFIATSHNTYLMKDQLKGKSSVDAYINAFKRGCKCVELDCWDGASGEPVIYHGHTLTSKILFKDVIAAVRQYAFCVSDFPVILSFENHCSVEQQRIMANHLVNILGPLLYTEAVPEEEAELPSPDALRGYILVKARKLKVASDEEDDVDDDYSGDEDIAGTNLTEDVVNKNKKQDSDKDQVLNVAQEVDRECDSDADERLSLGDQPEGSDEEGPTHSKSSNKLTLIGTLLRKTSQKKTSKSKPKVATMAPELSALVAYCQAVTFRGFQHSKQHHRHCEMSSFTEKRAVKYAKEDSLDFLNYTRRQLSRIYPAGTRVDSSNYDPQPLWNVGCQLVALNYQTASWPMQLNQAMFMNNGGCGYVLKPEILRLNNSRFDPRGPFNSNQCTFLVIRVMSGNQVPYSGEKNVRSERTLSVQVRTTGVEVDCHKEKTKYVKNNGYNPVWNEVLGFRLCVPELASVRLQLVEGRDSFLGQFTLPVSCMQQGYRRVPLQTKACEPIANASLFVHVELKTR